MSVIPRPERPDAAAVRAALGIAPPKEEPLFDWTGPGGAMAPGDFDRAIALMLDKPVDDAERIRGLRAVLAYLDGRYDDGADIFVPESALGDRQFGGGLTVREDLDPDGTLSILGQERASFRRLDEDDQNMVMLVMYARRNFTAEEKAEINTREDFVAAFARHGIGVAT